MARRTFFLQKWIIITFIVLIIAGKGLSQMVLTLNLPFSDHGTIEILQFITEDSTQIIYSQNFAGQEIELKIQLNDSILNKDPVSCGSERSDV